MMTRFLGLYEASVVESRLASVMELDPQGSSALLV